MGACAGAGADASWPAMLHAIVPPHSESFGVGAKLEPARYLDRLATYASAMERAGVVGAFVYDFPAAMDPWLAAYDVLLVSSRLEPVVAVRPHQERPDGVARRLADLRYRFGRPSHVNVVAGATSSSRSPAAASSAAHRAELAVFSGDLRAELERRRGPSHGEALVVTPSSRAPGVVPADCVLMMARPRSVLAGDVPRVRAEQRVDRVAMLVGLVVRASEDDAWDVASSLYAPDRRQEVAGRLFMSQVVSSEHMRSYGFAAEGELHDERLWYGAPARGIDAPKLVGSPRQVSSWLRSCRDIGVTDIIVDLVPDPDEYTHIGEVFGD